MRIGIVCYASVGGSGVVATELALALADRGHDIHLVSSELPFRWRWASRGLTFERVEVPSYPLFREPQYLLALTNTLVRVSRKHRLDLIHAHYAVPHATAAYLAHQVLSADRTPPPRTVTTLHGTDITLVGSDRSYADVVAFSIQQSHGITAVSESLKRDTTSALAIEKEIAVIPNFLDIEVWARHPETNLRARLCESREAVIVHVSNFRPVKRVPVVIEIFSRIRSAVRARLVMIGDGPDRAAAEQQAADAGIGEWVQFVGEQQDLVPWLSSADLFLLPSAQESFGLAAVEAMACGVPVVASRVGGLPEVIHDGRTGVLCEPTDVEGMASAAIGLLQDAARRSVMAAAAAADVRARFSAGAIVPRYEQFYDSVLAGPA
ncbi:MAG: N-acetyl-alpha-D-glucosaminyl L-malate synthase BshA [Acidobacteria bacterium]|nr:N-acetyl-alpha-D-glucosaminyl L-malate synthase BshA [Acidobacteriota bacterium]